jgi:hypothetical protein
MDVNRRFADMTSGAPAAGGAASPRHGVASSYGKTRRPRREGRADPFLRSRRLDVFRSRLPPLTTHGLDEADSGQGEPKAPRTHNFHCDVCWRQAQRRSFRALRDWDLDCDGGAARPPASPDDAMQLQGGESEPTPLFLCLKKRGKRDMTGSVTPGSQRSQGTPLARRIRGGDE